MKLQSITSRVSTLLNKSGKGSLQIANDSLDLMTDIYEESISIIGDLGNQLFPSASEVIASAMKLSEAEELIKSFSKHQQKGSIYVTTKITYALAKDLIQLIEEIDEFFTTSNALLELILKLSFIICLSVTAIKLISFLVFVYVFFMSVAYLIAVYLTAIVSAIIQGAIAAIAVIYAGQAVFAAIEKVETPQIHDLQSYGLVSLS